MKKFAWNFEIGNETLSGDADTREQAETDMAAIGYLADSMEGVIVERSDEEIVAYAQAAKHTAKSKTTAEHLAESNGIMFKQLDGLKNSVTDLEMKLSAALFDRRMFHVGLIDAELVLTGLRELALAWNTEQHARKGAAHIEPPFVVILREFKGFKALEKRKGSNDQEKSETEKQTASA